MVLGRTGLPVVVRLGLIGGGPGAFIGPVHRIAAEMDREIQLVAGVFSSDPARSRAAGQGFGIDPARAYGSLEALIAGERDRPDGVQMVAITTPNHLHFAMAKTALEAGIAVMSDKPATATLAEATALEQIVARTGTPYRLTYTYTGYPMVREMRARIAAGAIGKIRKFVVEYLQGWLADPIEGDNKQAAWRVDPARAGIGACIGDIGVHGFNLLEFVTGEKVASLNADLVTVVDGRTLDDDCTVGLRLDGGAHGILLASQIATGERNTLRIRVYGATGSVEWTHDACDQLRIGDANGTVTTLYAGGGALGADARAAARLPAGHPEGYLEAFANLYRDFAGLLNDRDAPLLPGIESGLRSMAFVDTAVRHNGAGWVDLTI